MEKKIPKVIKNGKVAIAISPGFGSGWTTWNKKISPFEPKVIKMIEQGKQFRITGEWCERKLGLKDVYCGSGVENLEIAWIKKGSKFSIDEYDGSESLYIDEELEYIA